MLREYATAIDSGRLRQAYEMMTPEYRSRRSFDSFARQIQQRPQQTQRAVTLLSSSAGSLDIHAEAALEDGDKLQLVYRDGQWWIASDPLDFYRQDSPREALRSFVRALEHRRYDVVLRFVPNKWAALLSEEKLRQSWEGPKRAEMAQLLAALRRNLETTIRQEGAERASMAYGDRHTIRFLREDALWKIEDPD